MSSRRLAYWTSAPALKRAPNARSTIADALLRARRSRRAPVSPSRASSHVQVARADQSAKPASQASSTPSIFAWAMLIAWFCGPVKLMRSSTRLAYRLALRRWFAYGVNSRPSSLLCERSGSSSGLPA